MIEFESMLEPRSHIDLLGPDDIPEIIAQQCIREIQIFMHSHGTVAALRQRDIHLTHTVNPFAVHSRSCAH